MKHRSPIRGYNHNIRYGGRLYHVQTEDSGVANPHIFTHLFHAGTILSSKRVDYQPTDEDATVQRLMQAQHKSMLRDLSDGLFDIKIAQFFGERVSLRRGKDGPGGADAGAQGAVDEGVAALDVALAIPLIEGDTEVTDQDLASAAEAATALAARISLPDGVSPLSNPPPPIELPQSDTVPMPRLDLEALEALDLPLAPPRPARQPTPARGTRFPPPSAPRLAVPQQSSGPPSATRLPAPQPPPSATRLPPPQPPPSPPGTARLSPPSATRLPPPQPPPSATRLPPPTPPGAARPSASPPQGPPSSARLSPPQGPPSSARLSPPQGPPSSAQPSPPQAPPSSGRLPPPIPPQSAARPAPQGPPSSARLPSPQAPPVALRPPALSGPASSSRLPTPQGPQSVSQLPTYDSGYTPSSVTATPVRGAFASSMSPQTVSGRTPVRVPAVADPARARSAFDLPPPAGSALASPQGSSEMADPPHLHYTPVRVPAVPRAKSAGPGVVVTRSVVVGGPGGANAAVPPGPPRRPNSAGGTSPHGNPALAPLPEPALEATGDPTIFGEDPYTDKSLDEVILAYLAEDSEK